MRALRILIVDDDRDFSASLALLMRGRGHEVELAYSGEEAIEKFREQDRGNKRPYDITFMDVRLPGKNGVESLSEIHKLRPSARIVMMTGYSVEQLLEQAVNQGDWGVLDKPLDMLKVLNMLDDIKPDGILVVDDDADFVKGIRDLLVNNGYTVFVAANGQQAIERVRANGIDILILDLRLPILNGLETYLDLKRTGHAIPTIIVTAYPEEESDDIDKLRSSSVSGILRKPFDPRELLKAIERLSRTEE
jgi:two-component system response regulator HydG